MLKKYNLRIKKENRPIVFIVLGIIVIFYGLFFIFPLILGLVGSFHDWNPISGQFDFSGFRNYLKISKDPHVLVSLKNTFNYALLLTFVRTFLGMLIAVAINSIKRFRTFFRTAFFIPVISSLLAASLIWSWIFDPNIGIINNVLRSLGMDVSNLLWLKSSNTAIYAIMIATIWKDLGFGIVLYLAGLSNIPVEVIEASHIDGSSPWQTFWRIKFPLLQPTTIFVLLTGTITYFQIFVQIAMMTSGGPAWSTSSMLYLIYYEAFKRWNFGYAAALSQILFALIAVVALFQFWALRRYWKT